MFEILDKVALVVIIGVIVFSLMAVGWIKE
jgi:hypothetical protein